MAVKCPTNRPPGQAGRVVSYLAEILGLSPAEVRAVSITLQATLSSATPGTDNYKVPSDQELVITGLQAFLRFPNLNTEPTTILGYQNPPPSERWFIKSQNCLLQLTNTDRNLKVFDNRDTPLSAFCPPVGAPYYWPIEMPLLVPANQNLQATFTLQDVTAAIIGNATIYGVTLLGALIPKHD